MKKFLWKKWRGTSFLNPRPWSLLYFSKKCCKFGENGWLQKKDFRSLRISKVVKKSFENIPYISIQQDYNFLKIDWSTYYNHSPFYNFKFRNLIHEALEKFVDNKFVTPMNFESPLHFYKMLYKILNNMVVFWMKFKPPKNLSFFFLEFHLSDYLLGIWLMLFLHFVVRYPHDQWKQTLSKRKYTEIVITLFIIRLH